MRGRTATKVRGTCRICGKVTHNALVVKGKWYTDSSGQNVKAADSTYHRECYRMQTRGLLSAGSDAPAKDSTGSRCCGCNTIIEEGDKHAHRNGQPYHKECLI